MEKVVIEISGTGAKRLAEKIVTSLFNTSGGPSPVDGGYWAEMENYEPYPQIVSHFPADLNK